MKKKPEKYQYKPTPFMLPTSHYDKNRADRAVLFIQSLKHTKGVWSGKPFYLFPWQEQIIRDLFGIIKENGYRQFNTAYIEIGKKNGKRTEKASWLLRSRCICSVLTMRKALRYMAVRMTVRRPALFLTWPRIWCSSPIC